MISISKSPITSCSPAFSSSPPGLCGLQQLPTLPLSHPSDKLSQHYVSSLQQKAFLLVNTSIISPPLRLLPLRSLKSSWSLQDETVLRLTVFSSHLWHCHFFVLPNSPPPSFSYRHYQDFLKEMKECLTGSAEAEYPHREMEKSEGKWREYSCVLLSRGSRV